MTPWSGYTSEASGNLLIKNQFLLGILPLQSKSYLVRRPQESVCLQSFPRLFWCDSPVLVHEPHCSGANATNGPSGENITRIISNAYIAISNLTILQDSVPCDWLPFYPGVYWGTRWLGTLNPTASKRQSRFKLLFCSLASGNTSMAIAWGSRQLRNPPHGRETKTCEPQFISHLNRERSYTPASLIKQPSLLIYLPSEERQEMPSQEHFCGGTSPEKEDKRTLVWNRNISGKKHSPSEREHKATLAV